MTSPLVSVVVATYKSGDYLREAIASAVAQTFTDLEVLVSDDAADPAAEALAASFADPRVRYQANPTCLGAAGNHWAAIRSARGTWIGILNHDDRWQPEFVERMLDALSGQPDAVLGFCDHHVIDAEGVLRPERANELSTHFGRDRLVAGRQPSLTALTIRQTVPMAMGALFKREAVDVNNLSIQSGPAYDLWLTYLLARSGGSAVYVAERLTCWREHARNLTAACGRDWVEGTATCWAAMASDPALHAERPELQRAAGHAHACLSTHCLRTGEIRLARSAAWAALRYRSIDCRALAALAVSCLPPSIIRRLLARS